MRFLFLFFALSICGISLAQIESEPGQVILLGGDSLDAVITYSYDDPDIIYLKQNNGSEKVNLVNVNKIFLSNGQRFKTISPKEDKREMVKVIIESSQISLYLGETGSNTTYFVEKDQRVHQLKNNNTDERVDGKVYRKESHQYIAILTALTFDKQHYSAKLKGMSLSLNSLIDFLQWYNMGEVSYHFNPNSEANKESNSLMYISYSNITAIQGYSIGEGTYGLGVGVQHYFDKNRRSSIRVGLDHSKYNIKDDYSALETKERVTSLSFVYLFDFYKTKYSNVYGLVRVVDLPQTWDWFPKLGMGLELKPEEKFSGFFELNGLLRGKQLSVSLGLKFDL